ncbi:MAG: hypothetical protein CTY38_00805 [Methylotenera sp.]|uniref:hypothetical protein n=1 Tax=Methylotenera sp. TaxID=2051956 RepID=UPI000D420C14|nr:hypothetical protein [Methylotenera sp.]PPC84618.1 MAG: hypothetical protein CTY38_00805 [Methylotenera sp.]
MDHANQLTVSEDDVKSAFQRHCLKQPELQDVIKPGESDCTQLFPSLWQSWQQCAKEQSIELAMRDMRILMLEDALLQIGQLSRCTKEIMGPNVSFELANDIAAIHQWSTGTINMNPLTEAQVLHFQKTGDLYASASLRKLPAPK